MNRLQLSIGEWLRDHEETYLSSFVAGRRILVSCIFMCFSINFQTNSCGFFFPDEIVFSSILRMKTIFFGRHSILREKKSQLALPIFN